MTIVTGLSQSYLSPNNENPIFASSASRQLLQVVSGRLTQRYITSSSTISDYDCIVTVKTTVALGLTLPSPLSRRGLPLTFKDVNGTAATANITLTPDSTTNLIDGSTNYVMAINRQSVTLNPFNDGTNTGWFIT